MRILHPSTVLLFSLYVENYRAVQRLVLGLLPGYGTAAISFLPFEIGRVEQACRSSLPFLNLALI